ncbi:hypothetical protein [Emticicia agri]|uniref:DUF1080 domain-containing protein n=1 Tax=Emticicia agri TaxID=2492393 RepID=A0A4Q5LV03_9BACT|nr:hypothetical protein [Emticicia agri]RYU93349.1 hypothetical protein EWM59_22490 [Emticicia agri]
MKFLKMLGYLFVAFIALMGFAVWYSQTPEGKAVYARQKAKAHADSLKAKATIAQEEESLKNATLLIEENFDGNGSLKLPVFDKKNDRLFYEDGKYKAYLGAWKREYYFGIGKELNNFVAEVQCDVGSAGMCGIVWALPLVRSENKTASNAHFVKTTDGWRTVEIPPTGMSHAHENGSRWVKDLMKDDKMSTLKVKKFGRKITCYIDNEEVRTFELSANFPATGEVGLLIGKRDMPQGQSQFGSVAIKRFRVWELK